MFSPACNCLLAFVLSFRCSPAVLLSDECDELRISCVDRDQETEQADAADANVQ